MSDTYIKINQLNKYYNSGSSNKAHILKDVTLDFPQKGLVCILGESGSGKTTLLHAAGALDVYDSGTVAVNEYMLKGKMDRTAAELRNREYGFIFQNYYLLEDETVYENLRLALCLYGLTPEQEEERIDYVLQAVEMYRFRKRKISMLSGGQRQRIAIARALIRTPKVIFADEPTGNLDEANTIMVMSILKKVSENCLILLTTHEKRIADFFADRIIRIKDGNVYDDTPNTPSEGYKKADDHNIYLKECFHQHLDSERLSVDYYYNQDTPLSIQLIQANGKLYLSLPDDISAEILTSQSDVTISHQERAAVHLEDTLKNDYSLPALTPKKKGTLSFSQIWNMAFSYIGDMKRRLILPLMSMLLTAILTIISVSDYMTLSEIRVEDFIRTNSNYLQISVERSDYITADKVKPLLQTLLTDFIENGPECTLYAAFNAQPVFTNTDFTQLAMLSDTLYNFTYTPLTLFDESTLIYGRMPEAPNEVIIDRWILDNFMARSTSLSKSITNITYFLDKELTFAKKDYSIIITGISDSGEPSLYIDAAAGLGIALSGTTVASLSSLQKAYPGEFEDFVLSDDTILLNENRYSYSVESSGTYSAPMGISYNVAGIFPEDFPATYVIGDNSYNTLLYNQLVAAGSFVVFTEDKDAVRNYFSTLLPEECAASLRVSVTDQYASQLAAYTAASAVKVNARILITAMILLMSLMMLYVSMKTNAMRNIGTISVYRLMGISNSSILMLYGLQILILSCIATLSGCILTSAVLHIITSIAALGLNMVFSFQAMCLTIVILFVVNLFAGLIPIISILRIPPAQLAAKSDI